MEITWQGGRLDDKDSGSHPEAHLHPEAELHLEAKCDPGAEVTSGGGFASGSECARACGMKSCIRKPKSISQRVQESNCTMIRNVNYFSEVSGAELI